VLGRRERRALRLAPEGVLAGLHKQLRRALGIALVARCRRFDFRAGKDGARIGGGVLPDVIGHDDGGLALAADVDLEVEVLADAGVKIREADRALAGLLRDDGREALALGLVVRDHGAGGHIADGFSLGPRVAAVNREALAQHAPTLEADGLDAVRQILYLRVVAVQDLLEGRKLALKRGAADEVALGAGERNREFRERHRVNGDLAAQLAFAHLVAVERQRRLHAQCVARAEARGPRAQLHEAVPEIAGVLGAAVEFEADGLAGVAGLGDADGAALHGERAERVLEILLGERLPAGERHEQLLRLRALHRDGGPAVGDVCERHVKIPCLALQVLEILVDVAGVDDEEVAPLLETIEVGVVHRAAALVGNDAVLRLSDVEREHIARKHVLQIRDLLRARDVDTAHVAHVEDRAAAAAVEVLGDDAAGVLNRHLPAAEVDQRGPGVLMRGIEDGALEFSHNLSSLIFRIKKQSAPKRRTLL